MIYTAMQIAILAAAARFGWDAMGSFINTISQLHEALWTKYRRSRK